VDVPPPAVGDVVTFDVIDLPAGENEVPGYRQVTATLRTTSEHAYVFVAGGT